MRTKKVSRHYCDFCSRGLFSRPAMVKHELGCTANPERKCSLCEFIGNTQRPLAELNQAFLDSGADMKALESETDGCPMCMLAVCRAWNKTACDEDKVSFEYKAAREKFWRSYNDALAEARSY